MSRTQHPAYGYVPCDVSLLSGIVAWSPSYFCRLRAFLLFKNLRLADNYLSFLMSEANIFCCLKTSEQFFIHLFLFSLLFYYYYIENLRVIVRLLSKLFKKDLKKARMKHKVI